MEKLFAPELQLLESAQGLLKSSILLVNLSFVEVNELHILNPIAFGLLVPELTDFLGKAGLGLVECAVDEPGSLGCIFHNVDLLH